MTAPALGIRALDGGASLRIPFDGQVVEVRMGWQAARGVCHAIELATRLSPPWTPWPSDGGWADQELDVFQHPVSEAPGGGRQNVNAVFVRLIRTGAEGGLGEDTPRAIFASDVHPDGRPDDCQAVIWGRDGERVPAHEQPEAGQGGHNGAVGIQSQDVVPAVAVVGDLYREAGADRVRSEEPDVNAEGDGRGADAARAARCCPVNGDIGVADVREDHVHQSNLSRSVMRSGEDAESGARETASPMKPGVEQ